jgi:hypothetical protein
MSKLEWQEQLRTRGTLRSYILKGSKITATLTQVYSGDWVLWCGPLGVDKEILDEPERSIDELLQDAKAYLCKTIKARLVGPQVFLDEISDSESPQ